MFPRRPVATFAREVPTTIRWTGYALFLGFFGLFFGFNGVSIAVVASVDFVVGALTTLPFVGAVLYGGYWLDRSDLSTERYPRIGRWFAGGFAGFLLLNVAMILVWPADATYNNLSWALFAAAVGGAAGLGMGLFEARAVDRAVTAERNRVKREELARRNEQLERFAGLVSHDLRNPLNVASGRLALARREYESEHLDAVAAAHDRMEVIVERTLTLARSGRIIGDTESVDLATLAEECWATVTTADATLRVETSATVEADPDRLRHMFENLFRNTVEHGSTNSRPKADDSVEHGSTDNRRAERAGDSVEHGSTDSRTQSGDSVEHGSTNSRPKADDSVEHGSTDNRRAERAGDSVEHGSTDSRAGTDDLTVTVGDLEDGFYVEDDGPGIPEAERDEVFEAAFSTDDGGSGLGLSIVRGIAQAHDWRVHVTEGSDGGARFEVSGVDSGAD